MARAIVRGKGTLGKMRRDDADKGNVGLEVGGFGEGK